MKTNIDFKLTLGRQQMCELLRIHVAAVVVDCIVCHDVIAMSVSLDYFLWRYKCNSGSQERECDDDRRRSSRVEYHEREFCRQNMKGCWLLVVG